MSIAKFFRPFKTEIKHISLPEKFTFPFHYEAHELVKIATEELQKDLETRKLNHNFGLNDEEEGLVIGKMFGVLVVKNAEGQLGYLAAFSGKLGNSNHHEGFVPPVFDMLKTEGYFKKGEKELSQLTLEIEELSNSPKYLETKKALDETQLAFEKDIARLKQEIKVGKARRKQQRKEAEAKLSEKELELFKEQLAEESRKEQYTLKDAHRYYNYKLTDAKAAFDIYHNKLVGLKEKRKQGSNELQQRLFSDYTFLNAKGDLKSLLDIFTDTQPIAGAGECAAPKLLQFAYQNHLQPIAIGEFWWGASPKSEIRVHKNFYPSCRSKCEPILGHMLQGLEVDKNPMLENHGAGKEFKVVYEDDYLLLINKPPELLSVPGKVVYDSVLTRLEAMYPEATGPLLVHRLDMSTSGLLLVAKSKDIHKKLQAQFLDRSISKRYEALLSGLVNEAEGEINLPLRVDLDNRPRHLVCYDYGKRARTKWKKIKDVNGKSLLALYPITGRTHQLRVHCAHHLGLNTPILGDDLYGIKDDRLHLHAAYLKFIHPVSKQEIEIYEPSGFGE